MAHIRDTATVRPSAAVDGTRRRRRTSTARAVPDGPVNVSQVPALPLAYAHLLVRDGERLTILDDRTILIAAPNSAAAR